MTTKIFLMFTSLMYIPLLIPIIINIIYKKDIKNPIKYTIITSSFTYVWWYIYNILVLKISIKPEVINFIINNTNLYISLVIFFLTLPTIFISMFFVKRSDKYLLKQNIII